MFIPYLSSGVWTPAQITTSLWLDADDATTITESLGKVSAWNDKSGNNNHALQGTETKQPSFANGKLTFDGIDDCLRIADDSSLEITEGINMSVVIKPTADVGYIFTRNSDSSSNVQYGLLEGSNDNFDMYLNGSPIDTNIVTKNIEHVVSSNWDKINAEVFVDGSTNGNVAFSTSLVNQINTFVGCRSASTDGSTQAVHFEGDILEIILTPNSLSETDRRKIEVYLQSKWNTPALP